MASKHYYLFGWRIWSIVIDTEEEEENENIETDHALTAHIQAADGNSPAFGFTPWMPDYIDWRHTE